MSDYITLKKSNCKNCYKCIRYCPVSSIKFSDNQASVISDECVFCGRCYVICPQNAKEIAGDTHKVKTFIQRGIPVIASIAPSFVANYKGANINSIEIALKKLGFSGVEETAIGATIVKQSYEKMLRSGEKKVLISSCCYSVNLLIQKYFPNILHYLAEIKSPMVAHCTDIKNRFPEAKTVFIGPCISKKAEADLYSDIVDCAITFDELSNWLKEEDIIIPKAEPSNEVVGKARLFPITGGIIKSMNFEVEGYNYLTVDGTNNCISALKELEKGDIENCFIEMSTCVGSCVKGPIMEKESRNLLKNYESVLNYAGTQDFKVSELSIDDLLVEYREIDILKTIPENIEIEAVLKKMGKTKPEDELNCGTCGYDTCREKAIAVYQNKADLTMCLPFLKEKAESFSDIIIGNTPNAIIVLNDELKVQQINLAALKMLNISNRFDVLGEQVVRILDPADFVKVINSGINMYNVQRYLVEYNRYVEKTIIYDTSYKVIICIMQDVTNEMKSKLKKNNAKTETIEIADKVIENQMKIVQEIASLLGETAAETKIALTKLKESMSDE